MMIITSTDATPDQIEAIVSKIEQEGLHAHLSRGVEHTVIGVVGDIRQVNREQFSLLPGVERIVPISRPYKLCSREFIPQTSSFSINGAVIGGQELLIIAGPCAVEDRGLLMEVAHAVREAGAHALRGGAYKPRTSPYSFQGLGEEGLALLAEAREATGLPVVTEVMAPELVPLVARYADVLQLGARNMQNFPLLHAAGESQKPILLKRGMAATVEEFLMSAEYILSHDNRRVILCERGIRTFETATRNTLDISAVPVLKSLTHLPIVVDPSHATGISRFVEPLAMASVACGADGLMIEVHNDPEHALSDGLQSLTPDAFDRLVPRVMAVRAAAIGVGT